MLGIRNPSLDDCYDYGLYLVDMILSETGKSLRHNYPSMPHSQKDWVMHTLNPLLTDQLNYNQESEKFNAEIAIEILNSEQRLAFNSIVDSVYHNHNKIFFLHGSGSTGKTFVYKAICHLLQSQSYIVLCVSSSGISALLLIGGHTSHFMFKIPISDLNGESFCNIPKESQHAELI